MWASAPDYCANGITANQNMTGNAPPARLCVWFDDCSHREKWSGCRWWCGNSEVQVRVWIPPAEYKSRAAKASQVTFWERPSRWLIRSRVSSIVLFSGRADHWFPALCYCSCGREAAAGIARLLRVLSAEQWAAAPPPHHHHHHHQPTPTPPPPFMCVEQICLQPQASAS